MALILFLVSLYIFAAASLSTGKNARFARVGLSAHPKDRHVSIHATPWHSTKLQGVLPEGEYGDVIEVELTENLVAICVITAVVQHPDQNIRTYEGSLTDASASEGSFILSCKEHAAKDTTGGFVACVGTFRFDSDIANQWEIRPRDGGEHSIRQVNVAEYEETGDDDLDVTSLSMSSQGQDHGNAVGLSSLRRRLTDTNQILDIMVLYTPEAVTDVANGDIDLYIATAIDEANQILKNSQANMRVRLVHAVLVDDGNDYDGDMSAALSNLQNTADGKMDYEATTLRDNYGADVMFLLLGIPAVPTGYCGLGYLRSSQSWATSTGTTDCSVGYYTFLHEIGKSNRRNAPTSVLMFIVCSVFSSVLTSLRTCKISSI